MAVQSKTRKADTIVAGKALTERIQKELPEMNAQKLLSEIHALEEKLKDIYSGKLGKFQKIENKPFYYVPNGNFYVVDIAREQMPNSESIPSSVSEVPTDCMNNDQYSCFVNCYPVCPFFNGFDSNGFGVLLNKDGTKYTSILSYYNSHYRDLSFFKNGAGISISNAYANRYSWFGSSYLRLPISNRTGIQNAIIFNLMPSDLTESEKKVFQLLVTYQNKRWLVWNNNSVEKFSDDFYIALKKDEVDDFELTPKS